ncbi:hypothetical protein [Streptomyces sp. 900105245]
MKDTHLDEYWLHWSGHKGWSEVDELAVKQIQLVRTSQTPGLQFQVLVRIIIRDGKRLEGVGFPNLSALFAGLEAWGKSSVQALRGTLTGRAAPRGISWNFMDGAGDILVDKSLISHGGVGSSLVELVEFLRVTVQYATVGFLQK